MGQDPLKVNNLDKSHSTLLACKQWKQKGTEVNMKLFMCCLLLTFATMVATAPIRARRENVLRFLNDASDTTTDKTITAAITADRNPTSAPVKEQNSADMSAAKSREGFDANGFTDPGSHEVMNRKVVEKDRGAPSWRKALGGDKNNTGLMDMSNRPVQDQGSREHIEPVMTPQESRDQVDLNSQEVMTVDAGKVVSLSKDQVTDRASLGSKIQRKATPGGLTGMLTPGRGREVLDLDSLEENNGRPAPVGNRVQIDYDETREFLSSEINPIAPLVHTPSGSSVPARSRAS